MNHSPVLTNAGPSASSTEKQFSKLDTDITVTDADLDALNGGAGDYQGVTITVSRAQPSSDDQFSFDTAGASFVVGTFGRLQVPGAGGGTFGTFDLGPDGLVHGTLTIQFDWPIPNRAIPTSALVDEVLQHIIYRNNSNSPPASVELIYTINDGSPGGGQGSGEPATASGSITVNITDIVPVAHDDAFATGESTPLAAGANVFYDNGSGSDGAPGAGAFSVTHVAGSAANVGTTITLASGALVTVQSNGAIAYNPNGRFESLAGPGSGASNSSYVDIFTYTITEGSTASVRVTVVGVDSNDTLEGTSGNDTLFAGVGADTIVYRSGYDIIDGGDGSDTADFSNFGSAVLVDLGRPGDEALTKDLPTIHGEVAWRSLANLSHVENIIGTFQNDALIGDDGANTFGYTGGYDAYDGRDGYDDTADFSRFGSAVLVDLTRPGDEALTKDLSTIHGAIPWRSLADLDNIEHVVGTSQNDALIGNAGANVFGYTGGYDAFDGLDGADTADFSRFGFAVLVDLTRPGDEAVTKDLATIHGEVAWRSLADLDNIENVTGTSQNDALIGNAGANVFGYTSGYDAFDGREGADTADFSRFGFAVLVDLTRPGDEAVTKDLPTIHGSVAWRSLADLDNIENVTGTSQNDALIGNAGANVFGYTAGYDAFDGLDGSDTADFSRFAWAVLVDLGRPGDEALTKDQATIHGAIPWRSLADLDNIENVTGTSQNDVLIGNAAANRLSGGAGADALKGGGGADTFHFGRAGAGVSDIEDFTAGSGNDVLDLRDILAGQTVNAGNLDAYVRLAGSGANTMVSVDVDGAGGVAGFVNLVLLEALSGLTASDLYNQGNLLVA